MPRLGLISDTHGQLPAISDIEALQLDALVHAGDIGRDRAPLVWWEQVFVPWAQQLPCPFFGTWGNHDFIGEPWVTQKPTIPAGVTITVDAAVDVCGVKTWFSPWAPRYGSWAWMQNDSKLAAIYAQIPDDVQLIVSHTPPQFAGDLCPNGHVGSASLRNWLDGQRDKIVVCGHIHEGVGKYYLPTHPLTRDVKNTVINVSVMDEWYDVQRGPYVLEL
jgi:hypothetical protein